MPLEPESLLIGAPPLTGRRVFVAFSGGLDSTVLLHALARLPGLELRAVHVHHGLQAAADDWEHHCRSGCAALGIAFEAVRIQVARDHAGGPESAAREARYAALRGRLLDGDILATAHQADDQSETFLMRALRGSGPGGLRAMRPLQPFGAGWLWRPLLGVARCELADYAREHGLRWVEDPHNVDTRYERAWLRARIMPELRQRHPAAAKRLAASAALCAEADALLDERASEDAATVLADGIARVSALLALSPARRRNVLRWWIAKQRGLPLPPQRVLERLDCDLLGARADAEPRLRWPGAELRRYRDGLWLMAPLVPAPRDFEVSWNGMGRCELPDGCGSLESDAASELALRVALARGGERFRPAGSAHHRSLKNLFQERGIPPWQRRRTPLVFADGRLCWVGGLGPAEQAGAFFHALRWMA